MPELEAYIFKPEQDGRTDRAACNSRNAACSDRVGQWAAQ